MSEINDVPSNPTNVRSVADVLRLTRQSLHRRATVRSAEDITLLNGAERIRLTLEVVAHDGTPVELVDEFPVRGPKYSVMVKALFPEADNQETDMYLDMLVGRDCVVALDLHGRIVALVRMADAIQRRLVSRYPSAPLRAAGPPVVVQTPPQAVAPDQALGLAEVGDSTPCTACVAGAKVLAVTSSSATVRVSVQAWGERALVPLYIDLPRPSEAWTVLVTALGLPADTGPEQLAGRVCEATATARSGHGDRLWVELGGFAKSS